jgi:hypothetical protein
MTTRRVLSLLLTSCLLLVSACSGDDDDPQTDDPPTDEGAQMADTELAAEAYVAGYPLVVSVRTMQRLGGLLGVNNLYWQDALSGPQNRFIVAPNRDTLYSIAILDLRTEPMVLTLPEVTDRYYTYQFLDAWMESFAYVGTRATDGRAGTWAITPPGWEGRLPEGVEQIESPTPQVFMLGRFLVDDAADVANVTAISRQSSLRPLSALTGDPAAPAPPPLGEPAGTAQDIPTDATFYDELADALAINPPTTPAQQDLFADFETLSGATDRTVLDQGAKDGDARIDEAADRGVGRGERVNGWSANLDIGTYSDDLQTRAVVARVGWGANVAEEAVYPVTRVDVEGEPLDSSGGATYRITFPAGKLPPVDAFWSLSVYGGDMFFAEHPSGRYTIGDRTPDLVRADDGSLEIVLSHDEPAASAGAGANWLPVPDGPFVLMLRLYLPGSPVLAGSYDYPPVEPAT